MDQFRVVQRKYSASFPVRELDKCEYALKQLCAGNKANCQKITTYLTKIKQYHIQFGENDDDDDDDDDEDDEGIDGKDEEKYGTMAPLVHFSIVKIQQFLSLDNNDRPPIDSFLSTLDRTIKEIDNLTKEFEGYL